MEGPLCILVDSSSARHTRPWENEAHNCIGMKRDHSTLVKFSPNDSDYDEVLAKLNRMASTAVNAIPHDTREQLKLKQLTEREKRAIQDSLMFNRMETRFFDVETATSATCDWLFSKPEYDQWLDSNLVLEHHGFFWIKGKPGSGKSTIMKHAVEAATNAALPSTVITFFFNARGTELERSILGMYRSVLLQLISKIPTILDDFSHLFSLKINHGEVYEWNIGELQAILITIMKRRQKQPVTWFIDALDECKNDEILKLVKFFENIGRTAVSSGSTLHICLSTRHYPNIPIQRGVQLTLEKQDGHDQDITTYIDNEFRVPHSPHVARIKSELGRRSSGVFIWVRLVVELLNAAFRRGEGKPAQLQKLLDSLPEELDDLFTNILKADPDSKDKSILCFQWILFSKRPLNPEELYFGVLAGTEPTSIGKLDTDEINSEGIENFILHISKGLMEVSKTHKTVQFIHETVRDFFLLDGITKLEPNLATNVRGFSEDRLKFSCYQYMVLGVFKDGHWNPALLRRTRPLDKEEKDLNLDEDILRQFPFAQYAVRYVFDHAEVAQSRDINQSEFLTNFEPPDRTLIQRWIMLHDYLHHFGLVKRSTVIYDSDDSLIYILSDQNLLNLLLILIQNKRNVDAIGKYYGSPLQLAAKKGHLTMARHLIAAGADIEFPGGKQEPTALFSALYRGYPDVAQLLLENGARYDIVADGFQTPLILAAQQGDVASVQKLLQLGVNMDIEGGRALRAAVKSRNGQIFRLLLQSGANVNSECGKDESALQEAASSGDYQILQLLLQSGADVNRVGGYYGSALQTAAAIGIVEVVQLLLQSGANVDSETTKYESALQLAARLGNKKIVPLLLHAGANVDFMGGNSGRALHVAAACHQDEHIARLLLDGGADVNSGGGRYYGNALHAAASCGNGRLVQLFLQAGADVNRMGEGFGSALQVASKNGHKPVVQLLLDAGADVNSTGGEFGSALQEAVKRNYTDISELLRLHGAKDVEI
jgi:ankyrin repeat protein